ASWATRMTSGWSLHMKGSSSIASHVPRHDAGKRAAFGTPRRLPRDTAQADGRASRLRRQDGRDGHVLEGVGRRRSDRFRRSCSSGDGLFTSPAVGDDLDAALGTANDTRVTSLAWAASLCPGELTYRAAGGEGLPREGSRARARA